MTLLEMTVALFVASAVMIAIVQLVGVTAKQRRTLEQRRVALQEVANQAERIAMLAWDQTAPDELKEWQPAHDLVAVAPKARCAIAVSPEAEPPLGRKIRLSITETNATDQPIELAALTIWKFAPSTP